MIDTKKLSWDEVCRLWDWHKAKDLIPITHDEDGEVDVLDKRNTEDAFAYAKRLFPYD